jgi:hypothetical protein
MRTKHTTAPWGTLAALAMVLAVCCPVAALAATADRGLVSLAGGRCPYVTLQGQATAEIAAITFTDVVHGINGVRMKIPDAMKKKFRIALVTIRVRKPAGMRLTIPAAALTLHYYHGSDTECAPCEGISSFSRTLDMDRPVRMSKNPGPGFVKQTTGARSTQSTEVYFEAVFNFIERDIKRCWLCVGQPSASQAYVTQGW